MGHERGERDTGERWEKRQDKPRAVFVQFLFRISLQFNAVMIPDEKWKKQ